MRPEEARPAIDEAGAVERIRQLKRDLGNRAVILVHHYQRDEVMQFADYRGDSLELSRVAASAAPEADYIVFCGVDFMAETAAMLCQPRQTVLMPAADAGCPMARMARAGDVASAWQALTGIWGEDIVPITYQNSYADVKAFCGSHGGAVCTSANCRVLLEWAWQLKDHVLFLPDENLGTNTALAMGIPPERIVLWDPDRPPADLSTVESARMVAWKGYCHVHTVFRVEHVQRVREQYAPITVIVHPECRPEVVQTADLNGSTSFILQTVQHAPPGARFAVGTEINMVSRLAKDNPDKLVVPLARSLCGTMFRTNVFNLCQTLESIVEESPIGVVRVAPEIARWANTALERMLSVK